MSLLVGKKILITGLLSNRSIAYGISKVCKSFGAELAFTYQSERFKSRVEGLAAEFESNIVLPCDVTKDQEIVDLFVELNKHWDGLDGLLHSIAYSPAQGLTGDFVENVDRETFNVANDITAYSFTALAKHARSMLKKK